MIVRGQDNHLVWKTPAPPGPGHALACNATQKIYLAVHLKLRNEQYKLTIAESQMIFSTPAPARSKMQVEQEKVDGMADAADHFTEGG